MFFYYVFYLVRQKEIKVWELLCYPNKKMEEVMENNQNAVTQTEDKNVVVDTQTTSQNEPKTFTQEEVNAMLAKEKKKMPSKEEMQAFNEWKESQKTEAEKQSEIIKENETLKAQLLEAQNKSVVANAGVDAKFQKFVMSEVLTMEGEFEDNLTTYLKENPQYLFQKEEKKPTTTGFSQNQANPSVSEEKTYLDKKYANNPYYKK